MKKPRTMAGLGVEQCSLADFVEAVPAARYDYAAGMAALYCEGIGVDLRSGLSVRLACQRLLPRPKIRHEQRKI